ncbi:DUF6802 family protein [Saccharomonospora azurea]|uniref:DUF6802 domain-containing protein n=1 Tax=Saccharomonospora azurea NA-128 TaxID=882081 RepID=H8GA88_9PSEU|nr:DUF6802 family protein [Saccharomonospora azurea]EHK86900.1 hypothetical protein SZMC14600_12912 [Saccharomonospora azurea SZMC 14600]EHY89585.1 hypothetical protein SacazDRAFT_02693 [Saccharomonospora azurea NA-128]
MWAEESGGTEGPADDLLITVDGEDYSAPINYDIDEDGVADTAVIEHADGSLQAFVDEDGDGEADAYLAVDAQGRTTAFAEYDETSGDWVGEESPGGTAGESADTQASTGGNITAEFGEGDVEVGPATVDTDQDGVNDTAVVTTDDGTTIAFTDMDGDGDADVAVEIDEQGNAVTYEHSGDGEWIEVDSTGPVATTEPDSAWGRPEPLEGVARIDSVTGQWISQN